MKRNLELLMPAGNLKKLKAAFHFGADAVYLGGKSFSLRAFADNFTFDDIKAGVEYAHNLGKKVYVTANIFAKNADLDSAREYFVFLESVGVDAVLISDIGLVCLCKECAPNLTIHLSTQANTTNLMAVKFWKSMGVKRVVLARELTFDEILAIHNAVPDMELEAFVHGAMCMSFSGRCLLSSYFSGRSANRGECIQPCRWGYRISDERHANKPLDLEQDERGTYIMNSRDLRLLEHIPELHECGIVSLKVEGRMKSEFYVATVANAYRHAIDEYYENGKILNVTKYNEELETVAHRTYTDAYFDGDNVDTICHGEGQQEEKYVFTAVVQDFSDGIATVEMRNRFMKGDILRILSPDKNINTLTFEMGDITHVKDGIVTDDAKLVQHIYSFPCPYALQVGDILTKDKK